MTPDDIKTMRSAEAPASTRPLVRLAMAEYDRTRPLIDGRVKPAEFDLTVANPEIGEFCRRPVYEEFDVAEMSLSMYVAARVRGEKVIALPIFPLRMAVLGYIFCLADAPYRHPSALIGKRVASIGYRYTVNLWLRGMLKDHYGLAPEQLKWVTGEREGAGYVVPPGIDVTIVRGRSPGELLLSGEVDFILGPEAPDEFHNGDPRIRRLFPDAQAETRSYFQKTGILPITHTVVMGEATYRQKPWITAPMVEAFRAAQRSIDTLYHANPKHVSFADGVFFLEEQRRVYGKEPYEHGLGPKNRNVIDTFVRYAHEQGYIDRRPVVEELFAENTHGL